MLGKPGATSRRKLLGGAAAVGGVEADERYAVLILGGHLGEVGELGAAGRAPRSPLPATGHRPQPLNTREIARIVAPLRPTRPGSAEDRCTRVCSVSLLHAPHLAEASADVVAPRVNAENSPERA